MIDKTLPGNVLPHSNPGSSYTKYVVVIVVFVVVFTLNRHPYPASSVNPTSVVNPDPREILIVWPQTVRQRHTKKTIIAN